MSDTNPTFNTLWAAWTGFEPGIQKDIYGQAIEGIMSLPLTGVVEHLAGMPDKYKKFAWEVWAEKADLSGYSLQEIISAQDTEPYHCIYEIVKAWLRQVDLSKYGLVQVKKTSTSLRTKDDIIALWTRWTEQADLSSIGLEALIKQVSDLSPDVMVIVLGGYKRRSGNWQTYSPSYKYDVSRRYHIPQYVVDRVNEIGGYRDD